MKHALFFYIVSFCFSATSSFAQTAGSQVVLVAAHRGDWRNAPENSLMAVEYAIAMGVDMVEVDLAMTKDSVVVIMHDETVDRTTNGRGKPADYTFEEIRKLRLKNGLGRLTSHQIPTLEEVMQAAKKGHTWINLDKSFKYYKQAFAICKKTGTLQQALFKTEAPYQEAWAAYGSLMDSIVFMPVINLNKPGAKAILQEYLQKLKPYSVELIFDTDTAAVLQHPELITNAGTKIWINSLWASLNAGHDDDKAVDEHNKKDSWDWILAHGATLIQTDRPKELLAYLKSKGLHQ